MNERSAPYPFLRNDAQMKYNSQLIDLSVQPLFEFYANDEWVYLSQSPFGGTSRSAVGVSDEDGGTLYVDEPFFVSGKKRFVIQQTAGFVRLVLAKRRELLSWNQDKDSFDSNSPNQTLIQGIPTFNLAYASAANWIYLDSNLVWQQAAIGDIGAGTGPFGWFAPTLRAGRYYDVEYQIETTVGTLQAYIVHRGVPGGTARPAFPIYLGPTGPTGNSGIVHVGDDSPVNALAGYAAAGHAQCTVLGSTGWTIAFANNVAATLTGRIQVTRRGF